MGEVLEGDVDMQSFHGGAGSVASRRYFYIIAIMKSTDALVSLSALASEARLGLFRLLLRRGPAGCTPSDLARRLGVPAPTLSFHLRGLLNAQLVTSRREGRRIFYSANLQCMNALVGFLTEHCCILADEARGPNCKPLAASEQVAAAAKHQRA